MKNNPEITHLEEINSIKENYFSLLEENKKLIQENANLQHEILYLKNELDKLKKMIFGSKSERFVATNQTEEPTLDLQFETIEPKVETETVKEHTRKKKKKKITPHSRLPIPAHFPRVEVILEPNNKVEGSKKIGEEITEVLEYEPGKLFVTKYIRPKYAMPDNEGVVIAEMPELPIPKGNAAASLLAFIMISKFVDHLPFYRQIEQFKRIGLEIPQSTINGWFSAACRLLEPLYETLKKIVLASDYLQADESPMKVQTRDKKGKTHQGYQWVYNDPPNGLLFFDYQKTRSREGPTQILKNFKGTIQCDGYSAYDIFEKDPDITLLACMAHVRRKFYESLDNDKSRAEAALLFIQKLYKIEEKARNENYDYNQRYELRQKEAIPILAEFKIWLQIQLIQVLPKSAIGKAITYALNMWSRLEKYVDNGKYEIDNNLIENSIRPLALGRKNYLFAGSHQAAQRASMMYSFFGSCKLNNVEPYKWLKEVIEKIPTHKANRLEELLPHKWNK